MSEDITADVVKQHQIKVAMEISEKYGLSAEMSAIAATQDDPHKVAQIFTAELVRNGQRMVNTDLESKINDLDQQEMIALKAGNVAGASAAKRASMKLRNELRERQREAQQAAERPKVDHGARAQEHIEMMDSTARKSLLDRYKEIL